MKTALAPVTAAVFLLACASLRAETFPDPQLTAAATAQSISRAQEIEAEIRGVSAYTWGYPLLRMEWVMRGYIEVPANKPASSYRAAQPDRMGHRAGHARHQGHADGQQQLPSCGHNKTPTETGWG